MDGTTRRGFLAGCAAVSAGAVRAEESLEQRLAPPAAEGTLTRSWIRTPTTRSTTSSPLPTPCCRRAASMSRRCTRRRSQRALHSRRRRHGEELRGDPAHPGRLDVPSKGDGLRRLGPLHGRARKPVASAAARDLIGRRSSRATGRCTSSRSARPRTSPRRS